ncbi:MAG: TRAP transporter substrate-binding protein [Deltaproteobacteria bacterium]|nr:TRAP transporter substrate-binding protein [Deltaproteobacteria bacterium]
MKRITISLMIVSFLFSFYFVTPAPCAPIEMRIAHSYPEHTQHGINMKFFKKIAEEYTNGQLKVTIYPAASLFPIDKEIPMLLAGTMEACYNINGPTEMIEPAEAIYNIPFLMKVSPGDSRHLQAMMKSPNVEGLLVKRFEKRGIKRMGNVPTLFGFFIVANNKRPVEKMEDMKGLKIRHPGGMMGPLYIAAMGASAMTVTGAEVPVALNQGVVDGLVTTIVHYHDARWHTKFLTLPFYTGYTLPFLVNLKWWKGLPDDIRQTIENKVMPELMAFAFKEVAAKEKAYVDEIQKPPYNVKVSYFSD